MKTKGDLVILYVNAKADIQNKQSFENPVIEEENNTLIRIRDITRTNIGAESYHSSALISWL